MRRGSGGSRRRRSGTSLGGDGRSRSATARLEKDRLPGEAGGSGDEAERRDRELASRLASYVDLCSGGREPNLDEFLADGGDLASGVFRELELFEELGWTVEDDLPIAREFAGYQIVRKIGSGAYGLVFEARQPSLDRVVALKVLRGGFLDDERANARFRREARVIARLKHPGIVEVYSTGVEKGVPFISMELVEGAPLDKLLVDDPLLERLVGSSGGSSGPSARRGGIVSGAAGGEAAGGEAAGGVAGRGGSADPVARERRCSESPALPELPDAPASRRSPWARIAELFAGVAEGLQHAHASGVVHRDLKPSNLVLDVRGQLRILDFGLARTEGDLRLTETSDRVGTLHYMSPEQVELPGYELGPSTDIYGLGATLYETLAGRPPFEGGTGTELLEKIRKEEPPRLRRIRPTVPLDLEAVVEKCLSKEPAARFGTAAELALELRRISRGEPTVTVSRPWYARAARRAWRRRGRIAQVGGLLLLVAMGLRLGGMYRAERQGAREQEYREAVRAASEVVLWEELRSLESASAVSPTEMAPLDREPPSLPERARSGKRFFSRAALEARPGLAGSAGALQSVSAIGGRRDIELEIDELEHASTLLTDDPEAEFVKARAELLLGRVRDAGESLKRALGRREDYEPARLLLAWLQEATRGVAASFTAPGSAWGKAWLEARRAEREGDLESAAAAYARALGRFAPGESQSSLALELRLRRGLLLLAAGQPVEALVAFGEAKALSGDRIEAVLLEAKARFLGGKVTGGPAKAAEVLRQLYDRERASGPERGLRAACAISTLYRDLGESAEALEWAREKALAIDPKRVPALMAEGKALLELGEPELAIASFDAARRSGAPDDPEALISLAACYEALDRPGEAQVLLEESVLRRKSGEGFFFLGRARARRADFDGAVAAYREAIGAADGYDALAHNNLGVLFDREGLPDLAAREYGRAIDDAPGFAAAHFNLARSFGRQARFSDAVGHFQRAIDLGLDRVEAYEDLSPCLLEDHKIDEAIEAAETAVRLGADSVLIYKRLGTAYYWRWWLHHRHEDAEAAERACRRVVRLEPDWGEARYRLGELLVILGRPADARAEYREGMRRDPGFVWNFRGLSSLWLREDLPLLRGDELAAEIRLLESVIDRDGPSPEQAELLERCRRALLPRLASPASVDWWIERPEVLVPEGSRWRLWRGTRPPSPALEWAAPDFPATGWESAGLPLGHPSGAGVAFDLSAMRGSFSTVYVRRSFEIEQPAGLESLVARVRLGEDDGVVAFLNGMREASEGFPEDEAPRHDATRDFGDRPRTWKAPCVKLVSLDPAHLRPGVNELALFALASSLRDEDFFLDVELRAGPPRPETVEERARAGLAAFAQVADPARDGVTLDYLEGRSRELAGDLAAARDRFEVAAIEDPLAAEIQLALARVLGAGGDPAAAEAVLHDALRSGLGRDHRILTAWLRLAFAELGWSAAQTLARCPLSGAEDLTDYGRDVLWLLDALSRQTVLRINSGGTDVESPGGSWSRDRFVHMSGPSCFLSEIEHLGPSLPEPAVYLTSDVFWSRRRPVPGYAIPLPRGRYAVTLIFVEAWAGVKEKREFGLRLEGRLVLPSYSPYRENGFGVHDSRRFDDVKVRDGVLDIEFVRRVDDPELCGLIVERLAD